MTLILVPRLQKLRGSESSATKRVTALYAYETIVSLFPNDLQGPCIPEILIELKEKVANLRLVGLKVLHSLFNKLEDSQKQLIRSAAQGCCQDPDQDVRKEAQAFLAL